jgi:cation diffusion facilitator family transporter
MTQQQAAHSHVFLGAGHEKSERKTWIVIGLCGFMTVAEVVGGVLFGSVALVADGLHMSTHAGALLIAALAYTYARRHATDGRFAFGTGKLGDLAGFTSAIVLAMVALLIGYEAVSRLLSPVNIDFNQAIPIAVVGLLVNLASAWLLSGGGHDGHGHDHGHGGGHEGHGHQAESRRIDTPQGALRLEVFEDGVPPRFRLHADAGDGMQSVPRVATVETIRRDGTRQGFEFANRGAYAESIDEVPEPHDFTVRLRLLDDEAVHDVVFSESIDRDHGAGVRTHRDNNFRAALVHVVADAAVSVLVILGLIAARFFGWLWIDPVVGIAGAIVIANWSYGLIRDTGAILLDMNADRGMAEDVRKAIESDGDRLADLHLWRLGPGHLGAIVSVITSTSRECNFYRAKLERFRSLSHVTIEVQARLPGLESALPATLQPCEPDLVVTRS